MEEHNHCHCRKHNYEEHSHSHNHSELNIEVGCSCGSCSAEHHQNNSDKGEKLEIAMLIVSAVITFTSLILHLTTNISPIAIGIACGTATIISGYKTFYDGIKSATKLQLDETTLLTIAVVAAFFLGEFTEAALVTLLFQFGEVMEEFAVNKSKKSIEALAEIRPDTATVITKTGEEETPTEQIKVGSTILVKPYDRIPLDGVISEGLTTIDTSAITGESIPIEGKAGTEVLSGMKNGENVIKITTTKTAENSTATRILNMVQNSQQNKGSKEKFITRFSKKYTPIVIVLSVLVVLVPTIFGGDFSTWLYRGLICLVASCPCAIVISVPLSYFSGIGGASKRGIMIKGGKYIESLAKADCFVFDKTGTLTTGKISVDKVISYSELSKEEILSYCCAVEKYSSHPIASAIKRKAKELNIEKKVAENHSEKAGYGVTAQIDGKIIIVGSSTLLQNQDKDKISSGASIFLFIDNRVMGGISVKDTVRDEAKSVLTSLKMLGAKDLVMLTGDNEEKAMSVAKEVGVTTVYSSLLPNDKVQHMTELKSTHKGTVFVGDGINDAPVIALSDCGVAMGLGSDAAIESSDTVLSDGTLRQLPNMVKISRRIMNTIKTNVAFALAVKAIVIVLAIVGIAPMWLGVLSDTGLSMVCIAYAMRLLKNAD